LAYPRASAASTSAWAGWSAPMLSRARNLTTASVSRALTSSKGSGASAPPDVAWLLTRRNLTENARATQAISHRFPLRTAVRCSRSTFVVRLKLTRQPSERASPP
jgi:hypothetical protein